MENKKTKQDTEKILKKGWHDMMDAYVNNSSEALESFLVGLIPFIAEVVNGAKKYKETGKLDKKHVKKLSKLKQNLFDSLLEAIVSASTFNMLAMPLDVKTMWKAMIKQDPEDFVRERALGKKHKKDNKKKEAKK